MFDSINKNPIIYGSLVGVFEHFAGLAPRTLIDYKQYFNHKNDYQHKINNLNLKRLYKGTLPYLSGISFAHMWLFSCLELSKKDKNILNSSLYGMVGLCGHDFFTLPGDTIRMNSNIHNLSTVTTIKLIYAKHGLKGFFKGMTPSLLMNLPKGAIEFTTMMYLEKLFGKDGAKPFLYGAITGVMSSIVTSPLDTIKTMRQMQKETNLIDTYKYILNNRGWTGFFRGALLRSFQYCLSYGTYEWLTKNLTLD